MVANDYRKSTSVLSLLEHFNAVSNVCDVYFCVSVLLYSDFLQCFHNVGWVTGVAAGL